jgi:hypothetical protein
MKRFIKLIAVCLGVSCLAGCAATQQFVHFPDQSKVVEDPGKGRIYVMRPSMFGVEIQMDVSDGENIIGRTGPHGFLCWEREPGETVVSCTDDNTNTVKVTVEAGKATYIFEHLKPTWTGYGNELKIVSEAEADNVMKHCKPPKFVK